MTDNERIRIGLETLTVFEPLRRDPVLAALYEYLRAPDAGKYSKILSALYEANGGSLDEYVRSVCEECGTFYVRMRGQGKTVSPYVEESLSAELETLQRVADLTPAKLREGLDWDGFLPGFSSGGVDIVGSFRRRVDQIGKFGYGIFAKHRMFCIDADGNILPVKHPDETRLSDLIGYDIQRKKIIDNTLALLDGKPAANALLIGDAGTGKSSTVKAIVNEFYSEGLRIVEVRKEQIPSVGAILDELAENPLKFIIFIDDLSFAKGDDSYSSLKAILEGSVSAKSHNVVIYATSNRRHVVSENFSDRDGDDVHRNDTMQEMISLSERFGLHVTFGKPDKATYLSIVKKLAVAAGLTDPEEEIVFLAERFALERGGRSARLARQFIDSLLAR